MSGLAARSGLVNATATNESGEASLLAIYDFVAQRLAAGTTGAGAATAGELALARQSLGLEIGVDVAAAGANGDITSLSALASINGGQIGGLRNKLINGSMMFDQEFSGAATTYTAGAVLKYGLDQWYGYCTGANVTGQRVAGTAPNKYNYQFTGAASVTKIGFAQRMEAANTQDLAGQTATLSVDLANSLLTTVTWTAWYANTEDTFGTLASPTRTQIATGTFTVSSTLTRYSTQISIPSAATTGIEVELSVGAQTSGTWTIGRAQLEVGGVATTFEVRDAASELVRCQRYYERGFWSSVGASASTTSANIYVRHKVTKFAFPTVSQIAGTSLSGAIDETGTAVRTPGAISASGQTVDGFTLVASSATYAASFRPVSLATDIIESVARL